MRHATLAAVALFACVLAPWGPQAEAADNESLTAVEGLKVGHHTLVERPTGCTVVLAEAGAVAAVDVRGGAPGTRETDLLDPVNSLVKEVHAIVLSGGAAFGLDAASGVVRYLEERDIGYDTQVAKVPIVPAAILFDLGVGGKPHIRPDATCGYEAAKAANTGAVQEGNVGAGAGATVGKLGGPGQAMKAGIGSAAIRHADGLVVAALVAVNAVGDIVDPASGKVVAGVRTPDGQGLVDARRLLRAGMPGGQRPRPAENTTIGVVATNAQLTQVELQRVALMAHDAHTPVDGDTIFALATGTLAEPAGSPPGAAQQRLFMVGALAAEAMADAIVRAATQAEGLPGYPAARDLNKK